MNRVGRLTLVVLAAVVGGCGTLSETVQQRVEIAEECKQVLDDRSLSRSLSVPEHLLEQRLGKVGACSTAIAVADHSSGSFIQICALDEIARSHNLRDLADKYSQVVTEANALAAAINELGDKLSPLDKKITDAVKRCKSDTKALYCLSTDTGLAEVAHKQGEIADGLVKVRGKLAKLNEAISAVTPLVSEAARADLGAWSANFRAQLAKFEQAVNGDVMLLLQDSARNYAIRHSARRSLDLLHKALRPVDAAINRADDKVYGAISTGNLFFGNDIERAVSKGFESISSSYKSRLQGSSSSFDDFLWEMKRAACENLEKGNESSMVSELVDTMFIHRIVDGTNLASGGSRNNAASIPKTAEINQSSQGEQKPVPDKMQGQNTVSPLDVYIAHEWAARQLLLKRQIKENVHSLGGIDEKRLPTVDPVDEVAVERLAESAAAEIVDSALRASRGEVNALNISQTRLSPVATTSTVIQVSAMLSPSVYLSNVNTYNPTFAPVIKLPDPAAVTPQRDDLCSHVRLPGRAACIVDGRDYVITLGRYFPTGKCSSDTVDELVSEVAGSVRRFAQTSGTRFEASVGGYASARPFHGEQCSTIASGVRLDGGAGSPSGAGQCQYRNLAFKVVSVAGCKQRVRDGNVRLSAERAKGVARQLEDAGNGSILVREIEANGSAGAIGRQGNDDAESDRVAVIRLRPVGNL